MFWLYPVLIGEGVHRRESVKPATALLFCSPNHHPTPVLSLSLCHFINGCIIMSFSVCFSACLCCRLCLSLSLILFVSVSQPVSLCLFLSVCFSPSVCLSFCLSPSVFLSVCLSVCSAPPPPLTPNSSSVRDHGYNLKGKTWHPAHSPPTPPTPLHTPFSPTSHPAGTPVITLTQCLAMFPRSCGRCLSSCSYLPFSREEKAEQLKKAKHRKYKRAALIGLATVTGGTLIGGWGSGVRVAHHHWRHS